MAIESVSNKPDRTASQNCQTIRRKPPEIPLPEKRKNSKMVDISSSYDACLRNQNELDQLYTQLGTEHQTASEKGHTDEELLKAAYSARGKNSLSAEELKYLPNPDLSAIIKIDISSENDETQFDSNGTLHVNVKGKTAEQVQSDVSDSIALPIYLQGRQLLKMNDIPKEKAEQFNRSIETLLSAGFVDNRLLTLQSILAIKMTETDKKILMGVMDSIFTGTETGTSDLKDMYRNKCDQLMDLYSNPENIGKEEISTAFAELQSVRIIMGRLGFAQKEVNSIFLESLNSKEPAPLDSIKAKYKGLTGEEIKDACIKEDKEIGKSPNLDAAQKHQYLIAREIAKSYLSEQEATQLDAVAFNGDMKLQQIDKLFSEAITAADVLIANGMLLDYAEQKAAEIHKLPEEEMTKQAGQLLSLVGGYESSGYIDKQTAEVAIGKLSWPLVPYKFIGAVLEYARTDSSKRPEMKNLILGAYRDYLNTLTSEDQKIAGKETGIMLNQADILFRPEVPSLKSTPELDKTEREYSHILKLAVSRREKYQKLHQEVADAISNNDEAKYTQLRSEMADITKELEGLYQMVGDKYESLMTQRAEEYPYKSLEKGKANTVFSPVDLKEGGNSRYLKDTGSIILSIVKNGSISKTKSRLRQASDTSSNKGNYIAQPGNENLTAWNIDARLEEIRGFLTPDRIKNIQTAAKNNGVSPEQLAALLIAEQRDQTYAENILDLLGSVKTDTSIGIGQITISTAKKVDPKLATQSKVRIARRLSNEEYNIELAARILKSIIDEGNKVLEKEPSIRQIGSRYTSNSLTSMENNWGKIVETSYNDVLASGIFDETSVKKGIVAAYKLDLESMGTEPAN